MARVLLSRDDFLKSFAFYYNDQERKPLEQVPALMDSEMRDKQPLMHLFSKYVIRPNAFDRDPFILPKAAQVNKHYHTYSKPVPKRPEHQDDFETVEAPIKKKHYEE
jgi:hypothetical protein